MIAANPTLRAPRARAAARLPQGRALERAHRAAEGGGGEAPRHHARREGRAAVRDGRHLQRAAQARRDGGQHLQRDPRASAPATRARSTRWPRSTSTMKRWPDLIGVLQKKAPTLDRRAPSRSSSTCASPACSRRSSPTSPRRSRPTRRCSSSTRATQAAIAYLKTNYEKRRDWEKLIGVHQREIERIADAARARRRSSSRSPSSRRRS